MWFPEKPKLKLRLEDWKESCDTVINSPVERMLGKGMTLNERTFVKTCAMGLSRSRPEVLFEMNDGKTKNTERARAWKAASKVVGNDCNPNQVVLVKGSQRSSGRSERSEMDSTSSVNAEKEKTIQKQIKQNLTKNQTTLDTQSREMVNSKKCKQRQM